MPWVSADTVDVVDAVFQKYAGSLDSSVLTRHYHTVANADGNGGLYDLRMYINDPATQEYLCSLNADCGGFVADGWWVAHSGITAVPMGSSSAMLDHGKGAVSRHVVFTSGA